MPYTIPSYTVSPGTVYQPKGAGLILDQISGAIAAWSTRRLISTAPADIARGRDASTNEEDFTAAELAGSGFTDLAGAGDGFYVTLYDQIGSNNATQVTAASQPKGVDNGTLITDGVVPVLEFDGTDDYLRVPNTIRDIVTANGNWSVIWTMIPELPLSGTDVVWDSTNGPLNRVQVEVNSSGTVAASTYDGAFSNVSGTVSDGVKVACALLSTGGVLSMYIDGVLQSGTGGATTTAGTVFNIGANSGNVVTFNGKLSDFVIFNRVLSASEVSQLHTALS